MIHKTIIEGLLTSNLNQINDERGGVFHFLKSNNQSYRGFGEAYYSKINFGIVKGWKLHNNIFQNFTVPYGSVKFVIFDDRKNSSTKGIINEILLDDSSNYKLLSMPPNLWYSFSCVKSDYALLANIINQLYDPLESVSLPLKNNIIPYDWK
jgi:dTDP-4-dehydrorhamnose 3,5-epimerase